ncbi:MAG TPA: hypothetical protein VM818_24005 [Vicinamibacterales bacterium]|nr:hypothetical protein [Vicinamibacterales bacterium]
MNASTHVRLGTALVLVLVLGALSHVLSAQQPQGAKVADAEETREANLRAYVELLRSDMRAQKVAVITEMMQFTEAEDEKFWPVYREYETELAALNNDRLALIRKYAASYDTLTDAMADQLANGALDVEGRRHALKQKYYERFKSVLSPKTAARFLQVENQILLILDLQIAASLPIVQ